jgi:phospho-N-acetylmuramoyl-pentapeptide-transferase
MGALTAFLYFNVWPARIFLGDAGALSFGAMLAVIGLLTGSIVALVIIGGIFAIEIVSSAIQILGWKILKRPIFPLAPIHHTFLAKGWEEPKIVTRAWLAGIMLAIFGLWLATI